MGDQEFIEDELMEANSLIEQLERKLEIMLEALDECEEYFDNKADADCDQDGFVPNAEMKLLSQVRLAKEGKRHGF